VPVTEAQREKASSKDEVFWKILNTAILLDFRKGHQQWTLSELSRSSGITRSLIYYYFGKSRAEILEEAVKVLGEEFFGLTPEKLTLWAKGKISDSVLLTRKAMESSPPLGAFYFVHRTRSTTIGASIRRLENQYFKKISQFFPDLSDDQVKAIFGLLFGLVFAPDLSDEAIHQAVRIGSKIGKIRATRSRAAAS